MTKNNPVVIVIHRSAAEAIMTEETRELLCMGDDGVLVGIVVDFGGSVGVGVAVGIGFAVEVGLTVGVGVRAGEGVVVGVEDGSGDGGNSEACFRFLTLQQIEANFL